MRCLSLAVAILVAATAPALGARAMLPCAPHQVLIDNLQSAYGETIVASWIASNGYLVEITASDEGTTSMLVTAPGRMSCLAGTGKSFVFTDGCAGADLLTLISVD